MGATMKTNECHNTPGQINDIIGWSELLSLSTSINNYNQR